MSVRVRFAPSPTGRLHVGNIRAAVLNWLYARQQGGAFILRLDDTDLERSRDDLADAIFADLAWLGLSHDETFKQSDRIPSYDVVTEKLKASGHLYPCYETADELDMKRKLARAAHRPPVYDRAALKLTEAQKAAFAAEGRKPHWRFKLDPRRVVWTDLIRGHQEVDLTSISDPVLVRADGSYLYTLTSVADDIASGITHIIRGEDHVTNAGVQVAIFEALGATAPAMGHFPLIADISGEGLSKRTGALSISELREEGIEARAIVALAARLGTGHASEAVPAIEALIAELDFSHFAKSTAKFDPVLLARLSAQVLHETGFEDVKDRLPEGVSAEFFEAVKHNIDRLPEITTWQAIAFDAIDPVIEDAALCAAAADLLPTEIGPESWKSWTQAVSAETGAKGRGLFHPLRLALTGKDKGPEMARFLPFIGYDRAVKRLKGERA